MHPYHNHPAADILCNCPEHIMRRRELRENAQIIDLQPQQPPLATHEDKEMWEELRRLKKGTK